MTVLLIEEEAGVVNLLAKHVEAGGVGVVALLEIIVLQELFVLEMAVLGLDGVKLVPQSQVVFVTLLDLENLCFELRDQQVLLVAGEVNAVVVL